MVPRRQLNYCWTPVVNIHPKYCFGRTCLYNVTEPSDPSIVSKILDHLPSTETFSYDIMEGGTTLFTAPDRILNSYDSGNVTFDPTTSRVVVGLPISWKILGKPDVADLCHTLILLQHKGALHFLPTVRSQILLLSKKIV